MRRMTKVRCLGGRTQIGKILRHTIRETQAGRVNALVFVGDSFEEEIDEVCDLAGELGVRGVPAFLFQEGNDSIANMAFRQIAKVTGGARLQFQYIIGAAASRFVVGGSGVCCRRTGGAGRLFRQNRWCR